MEAMFTGIVEETGIVKGIGRNSLSVQAKTVLDGTRVGDSMAVNGVCLTVIKVDGGGFSAEIMPETVRLTNIGALKAGDGLNLERAMPANGKFGGHFVQGHIDDTGRVVSLNAEGGAIIAGIRAPEDVLRYVVKKGFIAVNGVSLTVVSCDDVTFAVSLVTFTRESTNLGVLKEGSSVNLEVDIMAKYIEKFYQPGSREGIIDLLKKYDYLKAR
jgi:riboflavin synthase